MSRKKKRQGERVPALADLHLRPTSSKSFHFNCKHQANLQWNDAHIPLVSWKTYVCCKHVATRSQELRGLEGGFVRFQRNKEWFSIQCWKSFAVKCTGCLLMLVFLCFALKRGHLTVPQNRTRFKGTLKTTGYNPNMVQFTESREDQRDGIMIPTAAEAGLDLEAPDRWCPAHSMWFFSPWTSAPHFLVTCEVLAPAVFQKQEEPGDLGSGENRKWIGEWGMECCQRNSLRPEGSHGLKVYVLALWPDPTTWGENRRAV